MDSFLWTYSNNLGYGKLFLKGIELASGALNLLSII